LVDIQKNKSGGPAASQQSLPSQQLAPPAAAAATPLITVPHTAASSYTYRDISKSGPLALATPAVRKIAKEHHIDLSTVRGTGPNHRITKEDVLSHLSSTAGHPPTPSKAPAMTGREPLPAARDSSRRETTSSSAGEKRRVPIRGVQRLMMKSMTRAREVQHLTYGDEVFVDKLVAFRDALKVEYEKRCELLPSLPSLPSPSHLLNSSSPLYLL
jgi:pyruvate/2-oxoglutarate dehydrogenase complex dihydrolipoamide acyltransferase (E2) component